MSPSPANSSEPNPRKSAEQPLNRACEACRLSKVRCLINPGPGSACQRCAKAGRQCVFAPPAKRRQRKRTDVRVAELEREVKQLTSLLRPGGSINTISPVEVSDDSMDEDEENAESVERESPARVQSHASMVTPETTNNIVDASWSNLHARAKRPPSENLLAPTEQDIIDRGIITKEQAEELLDIYRNDLIIQCPGVVVARDWTVDQFRSKKPALFHAVMAAASHSKGAALSNKLHEEVIYLYARNLFIRGEKSLQYVQALLVTVSYFTPPNTPAQLQVYLYGNMAASMALELGLASKPRTHEQLPKRAIRSLQKIASPEELLENCRTILTLYSVTAGFSMRLRRPNILMFNSWMEECQTLLSKSLILEDRRCLAWLRLQRIADEAYTAFGFDDASTSFTLSELRLQAILRIFERRMHDWKKSIPEDVMTLTMTVEYHQNMMSMYEFAMDGGRYDAPEFRNRHLTLPALDDDCVQPETLLSRSALQINATVMCINAAHSNLDCFLKLSIEDLQKASGVVFVRAIYALVALMKADYAIGTDAEGIGEVLDSKSLKVDSYLNAILKMTTDAIGPQKCRIPSHWAFVINKKLKEWHDEHQRWRKDGGHLKRNTQNKVKKETTNFAAQTHNRDPPAAQFTSQESASIQPAPGDQLSSIHPTPMIQPPQQQPLPNFSLSNPYQWSFQPTSTEPTMQDPSFGPDMTDFSAAFQNGDLYLWNDSSDNFGGWIPQGGTLYSELQFGSMGNPGI